MNKVNNIIFSEVVDWYSNNVYHAWVMQNDRWLPRNCFTLTINQFYNNRKLAQLHLIWFIWILLAYICSCTTFYLVRCVLCLVIMSPFPPWSQSYFQNTMNSILQSITKASFFEIYNNHVPYYMAHISARKVGALFHGAILKTWHERSIS